MPSRSNTTSQAPEPAKSKPKWTSRVGSAVRKASKKLSISSSSKSGSGDASMDRTKGASVDIPRSASPDFELISPVNPPAAASSIPLATSTSTSTTATTMTTTTTPAGPVSSSTSGSTPLSLKTAATTSLAVHAPSPIAESPAREADAMMQDMIRGPGLKDQSIVAELARVEKEPSTIGQLPEIPNIMTSPLYVEPPAELPLVVEKAPVAKPEVAEPTPVVKSASREPSPAPAVVKAASRSSSPSPATKITSPTPSTSPAAKSTSRSTTPTPTAKTTSRSSSPIPPVKVTSPSHAPAPTMQAPSSSSSTKAATVEPLDIKLESSSDKAVSSLTGSSTSKDSLVASSNTASTAPTSQTETSRPPVARAGRSSGSRPLSVFVETASAANTPSNTSSTPSTTVTKPTIPVTNDTPSLATPPSRRQTQTLLIPRPQSQYLTTPAAPPGLGPEPTLSSGDLAPPMVTIHPATPIMWSRSLQDEEDDVSDSSSDDDDGVPYGLIFRPKALPVQTPATTSTSGVATAEVKSTPSPAPVPVVSSIQPPPAPAVQPTFTPSSAFISSVPSAWPLPTTSTTSSRRPSASSTSDTEQEVDLDFADVVSSRESTPPITPPAHHLEFTPMIQVLDGNDQRTGDTNTNGKQQWPMLDSHNDEDIVHTPDEPVPPSHSGDEYNDIPNIPSFESPSSLRGSFYSPMSSIPDQRMQTLHRDEDEDDAEHKVDSPYGPVPPMDEIPAIPSIIEPSEDSGKAMGVVRLGNHVIGGYAPAEKDAEREGSGVEGSDEGSESGSTHTNISDVDKSEKDFDPEEMRAGAESVGEDVSKDETDPFADPMDSTTAWDEHWQSHAYRRRSYSLPQMSHDAEEDVSSYDVSSDAAANSTLGSNPFSSNANSSFGASNPSGTTSFNTSYGSNTSFSTNTTYGSNNPFASKSETQLPILHEINHALLGTPEPAQRLPPPPVLPYSAALDDVVLNRVGSLSSNTSSGAVLVAPLGMVVSGVGAFGSGSVTASSVTPFGTSSQAASAYATANPSPAPTPPIIPQTFNPNAALSKEKGKEKEKVEEPEELSYPYSPPTSPVIPGAYSSPTIPAFGAVPPQIQTQKVVMPQPIRTTVTTRAFTPPPQTARASTPPPPTARAFTPPPQTTRALTPPPSIPRPYSPQARIYAHGQFVDPGLKREGSGWDPLGSGQKKASPPTPPLALPIPFPESTPSVSSIKDPLSSNVNTKADANDHNVDLEKGPGLSPAYSDDIDAEGDIEGESEGYVRVGMGNMSPFDAIAPGAFSAGYGPLVGSASPVVGAKDKVTGGEGGNEEVPLTSVEVGRSADVKGADGVEKERERERDMRNPFDSVERLASTSSITLLNPGGIPLTSTSSTVPNSGFEHKHHMGESTISLGSSSGLVDGLPHPNTETLRGDTRRASGQGGELQYPTTNATGSGNGAEGDHDYTRWTVIGVVGTLAGVVTTGLLLGLRRIGVGIPDDRLSGAGGGRGGRQREPQFAALDLSSMGRSASTGWMEVGARGRKLIKESLAASTSAAAAAATASNSSTSTPSSRDGKKPRSPMQTTQPTPSLGMTAPALGMRRAHSHIPIRSNGQHHPTKMAFFLDILHNGPGAIGGLIFGGARSASTVNVGLNPTFQASSSSGRPRTAGPGKNTKNDIGLGITRRDSDQNSSSGLIMQVEDGDLQENGAGGGAKENGVGGSLRAGVLYVRDTVVWAFGRVSGWGVTR